MGSYEVTASAELVQKPWPFKIPQGPTAVQQEEARRHVSLMKLEAQERMARIKMQSLRELLSEISPQEQREADLEAAMRELDAEFPGAVLPMWSDWPF